MQGLRRNGATVAIVVMASAVAAGQKQGGPIPAVLIAHLPPPAPLTPTTVDHTAIVKRLLSFAGDGDDRITRDELPERMEALVSRGDKNQDGLLTPNEVIALVDTPSPPRPIPRFTPRGAASLAEIIIDLKLPATSHDRAMTIVNERTTSGNFNDSLSEDLYVAMSDLLGDEDYDNFVAAAARLQRTARIAIGRVVCGLVATPASAPGRSTTITP